MKKKIRLFIASIAALLFFTVGISAAVVTKTGTVKVPSWGAGIQMPGEITKDSVSNYGYVSANTGSALRLTGRFFVLGGDMTGSNYPLDNNGGVSAPTIQGGSEMVGWKFNFRVYSHALEPNSNSATITWSPL